MSAATMDDLVVLIPGITGSVLSRDGRDLWNLSARTVWRTVISLGDTIRSLRPEYDDLDADAAPDGVTATALIEDTHLVPPSSIDRHLGIRMQRPLPGGNRAPRIPGQGSPGRSDPDERLRSNSSQRSSLL